MVTFRVRRDAKGILGNYSGALNPAWRFPRPWPEHTVGAQKMTSEEKEPTTGALAALAVKPGKASPADA